MRVKDLFRAVGVLAVWLAASPAGAEGRGIIFGTVKEVETGTPVGDVVVSATSPSLEREQTVVSDMLGKYRIPGLPPGTYTVQFEHEMFRPYSRANVPLKGGHATKLEVSLAPEQYDTFLVLIDAPPAVNVGSTSTGRQFALASDFLHGMDSPPGSRDAVRSIEDLAPFIPGVLEQVGGLSINGASIFENEYRLDGLSLRDAVLGLSALSLSTELTQDTNIVSGGYPPEFGSATGGLLEAMTRSGSNELYGSLFAFWTPGQLEGQREYTGLASQDALKHQGDFGATLGGPLVKDKLWFFAGVTPALSRMERTLQAPGSEDGTLRSFDDMRSLQAVGKLTYLINQDHNVSLALVTAPASREGASTDSTLRSFHYSGALMDKRILVDANAGWFSQQVTPRDGASGALSVDRYQANARATWLVNGLGGTHVMKAGVDSEWLAYERPGARTPSQVFGGFAQDSASFSNRITLNVGARYDVQRIDEASGGHITSARLSPRVGLVLDPMANGRMKVFLHYGRFQGLIPLGLMDATTDVTLDPDLEPLSSRETLAGLEYEVLAQLIFAANYTHRTLEDGLALVPRTDGSGVVLANPGSGLAADSPRAARDYDAATVELRRRFMESWQAQVSYTWSRLTGNYVSPFTEWDGLASMQRLPMDRTHVIRLYGARELRFASLRRWRGEVGASYLGASGLLLDGEGKRTPWMQSLDAYLDVQYALSRDQGLTFRLDVFNVLNSQEPLQAERSDTSLSAVRYQPPRQVRLGVRYDF
ncbi:TonB-dependent receptor [Pyxidicoccus parkwayensis]|uniref:TonB-dependent receptor n=1 Tax=Pyxidicoccus parkwayensis TaxID=2813578 RepID=A0ABX7NUE5_9BACT|nr:TonB-dependent receptor [Pyxidicoccus parkwaysis]QSQ22499.1 TonB-dependent receptor [Pyxidicoccus parkwaysis]